jgi:DNA repair exonuclease SbcCD ATPase subunit
MLLYDIITIIIPIIIIIFIVLLIILFIIFNNIKNISYDMYEHFENSSNQNSSNYVGIAPVVVMAEQVNKLKVLDKIKKDYINNIDNLSSQINSKGNQLNEINDETKKKEEIKLKLEDEISKLNKNKEIHNSVASTIVKGITTIEQKEEELKKKEAEIKLEMDKLKKLKDKQIPEDTQVKMDKQQIDLLLNKFSLIEKLLKTEKKDTEQDICKLYSSMPMPTSQNFIDNNKKDISYLWCLCNDNINKNIDCMEYKNCLNHYMNNKDNKTLKEDELNLYFRCINKFNEYPQFLTNNN